MTSLDEILSFNPCPGGWRDILKGQKKTKADSRLFPLVDCLNSNSIRDVCWLIGKRQIEIDICVKFARKCVDSISHIKNVAARDAARLTGYAAYAAYAYAAYVAAIDAAIAAAVAEGAIDGAAATQKVKNKQFMIDAINQAGEET